MPSIVLDPALAAAAPTVTFGGPDVAGAHPQGKSLAMLRARLVKELGNRTDITVGGTDFSVVDEWINDAYLDLWESLNLPEAKRSYAMTLVPGQPLYLLPGVVGTVRDVSGTDASDGTITQALRKTDEYAYRKLPVRDDDPTLWFREQQMLVLWPTPTSAQILSVDVITSVAKLTDPAHYPILEDKWHEALFKAAKYRGWEALQNDTKALTTQNEMARLVKRKNETDAGDQAETYPVMRPVFHESQITRLHKKPTRWIEPGECD